MLNNLLVALSVVLLVACATDDGSPLGGSPGQPGNDPFELGSCAEMCDVAPTATPSEGDCVADEFQSRGYDLLQAPIECAAIASSVAGCNACMDAIGASDSDCAAVASQCL